MFKKILLIIGSILLGLNFGLLSCLFPTFLIIIVAFFDSVDPLDANIMAVPSLIAFALSSIGTYIYAYKKKRNHEGPNCYGMALAISFAVGALIAGVGLFIISADPNYGMYPQ